MQKGKNSAWLIWLCWLVYTCSYIGKVNYAANINSVMEYFSVDHSSAGLVSTLFFFAYGIGQVVNGLLCKKYNLKWMVFISLMTSSMANFLVAITRNFALIKYLWLVNGFSMSILWPSLVRLLAETLAKKEMAKSSVIMGTTVALGTFFVYALSAVFVKINFKLSFYLATGILISVGIVWMLFYSKCVSGAKAEEQEEAVATQEKEVTGTAGYTKSIILLSVVMLCFYGVVTNLIKDGLTTWVPSILKEQYMLDGSLSIILTLALPVVSIFGNAFALEVHKKIPDFVIQCVVTFFVAGIIIIGIILGMSLDQFWLTLIGFAIVCFLASSCNSLITSIFPLFMKGKVNSGFIAGIVNGCCYLGSTISSYGLGLIADGCGWLSVFWTLLGACGMVCVGAGIYIFLKKKCEKQ